MVQQNVGTQIGQAWALHRAGRNGEAIAEFESIISIAPESIDAHYGLGLAQRADGQLERAIETFRKARHIAEEAYSAVRTVSEVKGNVVRSNDLSSSDDDRYMMLLRMIGQRLAELGYHS